jgi:hypothetical protein
MIKLKNIVESKFASDQELYHYTIIKKMYRMLKIDKMLSKTYYEKLKSYAFSFSRSKIWFYDNAVYDKTGIKTECAIVFSADKLSSKYKMKPYNFFNEFGNIDHWNDIMQKKYHEYEERILSSTNIIPNVKRYIIGIYVSKRFIISLSEYDFSEFIYELDAVLNNNVSGRNFDIHDNRFAYLFDKHSTDDDRLNYIKNKIEKDFGIKVTLI